MLAEQVEPPCVFFSDFKSSAHIIGVVVSEITRETRMATARVMANSRKSRPTIPPMRQDRNEDATSERLMERTVNPICFDPATRPRSATALFPEDA